MLVQLPLGVVVQATLVVHVHVLATSRVDLFTVLLFNKPLRKCAQIIHREGLAGSPAAQLLLYPSDELRFKWFSVQCFVR